MTVLTHIKFLKLLSFFYSNLLFFLFPAVLSACLQDPKVKSSLAQNKYQEAFQSSSINKLTEINSLTHEDIQFNPREPNYHLILGLDYFLDGDLKKAENEFLETLRLDPYFFEAHKHLDRLYFEDKKWPLAFRHLQKSLNHRGISKPHEVHNWLALSYYAVKDFKRAEREWIETLQLT